MLNRLIKDASSLNVVSMRTCGNLFGDVPSDCGSASENAFGSKKRLPGSREFDGLNVSGLNIPLNPPAGMLKFAQTAGPFQPGGCCANSGVRAAWRWQYSQGPRPSTRRPQHSPHDWFR